MKKMKAVEWTANSKQTDQKSFYTFHYSFRSSPTFEMFGPVEIITYDIQKRY